MQTILLFLLSPVPLVFIIIIITIIIILIIPCSCLSAQHSVQLFAKHSCFRMSALVADLAVPVGLELRPVNLCYLRTAAHTPAHTITFFRENGEEGPLGEEKAQ